jgi:hypothetical protein
VVDDAMVEREVVRNDQANRASSLRDEVAYVFARSIGTNA